MNKKAQATDILFDNIIYLFVLIIFFIAMLVFVNSQMNGATLWEDYYAKEIVKVIDSSMPGDQIAIDVHKATEIAMKNKIDNFEDIFSFDNSRNEVCVKLSKGRANCYNYFNSVNVSPSGSKWVYLAETSNSVNRLHILIFPRSGATS